MKDILRGTLLVVLFACGACVVPQKPPPAPVGPYFSFSPPFEAKTRSSMTIALIRPRTAGTLFAEGLVNAFPNQADMARISSYIAQMLDAAKTDMEKIIVAKGFNTLGPFNDYDEMTYSQKERATLLFMPTFDAMLDFQTGTRSAGATRLSESGTAVVRGNVALAFMEPMTREKVWLKRFDLKQFSAPYHVSVRTGQANAGTLLVDALTGGLQQKGNTQADAVGKILGEFYGTAMDKMWNHLDSREILQLKAEAQKLKRLKRY